MTNNLLKALYLDWFENGLLKHSFFEVRHVPCPNCKQVAYPRFYDRPCSPIQWRNHHLFFGVNPRLKHNDSKNISHIVALYVDIDRNDQESMFQLREFQPRISALINSGRGLHAYWFLEKPVFVQQVPNISNILRGISKQLNSDPAAVSMKQLLRIPGTRNPKYNSICSEIFVDHQMRYRIDEFSHFQNESTFSSSQDSQNLEHFPFTPSTCLPLRFVRDLQRNTGLNRLWSHDVLPEFRSGSERDFTLCMKLLWRDYNPNEIATILLFAPYAKKYRRNLHYLSSTLRRATTIVEQAKLSRISSDYNYGYITPLKGIGSASAISDEVKIKHLDCFFLK
ncbi:RepB family DNA primase [bacterium]|nr:RepB family DNA primase [bacterium]